MDSSKAYVNQPLIVNVSELGSTHPETFTISSYDENEKKTALILQEEMPYFRFFGWTLLTNVSVIGSDITLPYQVVTNPNGRVANFWRLRGRVPQGSDLTANDSCYLFRNWPNTFQGQLICLRKRIQIRKLFKCTNSFFVAGITAPTVNLQI